MDQNKCFFKNLKNKTSEGIMGFFFGSSASFLLTVFNLIFTLFSFNTEDQVLRKYAPAYLVFLFLNLISFILIFISYKKKNAVVSFSNLVFTIIITVAGIIFSIVRLVKMKGANEYTANVIVTVFFMILYLFLIFGVIKDFISYREIEDKDKK